uniref:Uncharacterized protein n=1 Tax=Ditylenchus dipsaci TaxID=166011 RepID=A0A915EI54_9BILA
MELMMHDGTVRELIFMEDSGSHHSSIVVSGGAGNCHICLTDCTTGRTFKSFVGHTAPILGLTNHSLLGLQSFQCRQCDHAKYENFKLSCDISMHRSSGKLLVSGHEDASVMLYDVIGGRTVQTFRPHGDEVRTVRCSNAAYYLLSGSYDKRVVITDMRGDLTAPLMYLPVAEHADKVIQCRWHPKTSLS